MLRNLIPGQNGSSILPGLYFDREKKQTTELVKLTTTKLTGQTSNPKQINRLLKTEPLAERGFEYNKQ